jgi:hypothetical protein
LRPIAVAVVGVFAALDFADGRYAAPPVGKLRWKPPQLQPMRAQHPTGNRVEDVSALSRRLEQLARELDWPVIAVSRLDRGMDQRPRGA